MFTDGNSPWPAHSATQCYYLQLLSFTDVFSSFIFFHAKFQGVVLDTCPNHYFSIEIYSKFSIFVNRNYTARAINGIPQFLHGFLCRFLYMVKHSQYKNVSFLLVKRLMWKVSFPNSYRAGRVQNKTCTRNATTHSTGPAYLKCPLNWKFSNIYGILILVC